MSFHAALFSVYLFAGSQTVAVQPASCPAAIGSPMSVAGNAAIMTLKLKRVDGTSRSTRLAFDSGGGAVILDEKIAADLGLKATGPAIVSDGGRFAPADTPVALVDSFVVTLSTSKAFIHLGENSFDTRERIEGLLPGKALEPYQVVLDYPNQRFWIAPSGCVEHRGSKVPSPFLPDSGHPRIEVSVDDNRYGLLLDTGSRVSLARRSLLESLSAANPGWPHSTGASGAADMPGGSGKEFLLRVPEVIWGGFHITNVLFVSRPDETYSADSFETPAVIVGALGGNVLKDFRVEIDYPYGSTYLEQRSSDAGNDMNSAGLVLDVDPTNNLVVRAISTTATSLTKANVHPGDQILQIGGKRETPWTLIDASDALSGKVGDTRRLIIRRAGREMQTTVTIAHLL
jgi:hypothetical protein